MANTPPSHVLYSASIPQTGSPSNPSSSAETTETLEARTNRLKSELAKVLPVHVPTEVVLEENNRWTLLAFRARALPTPEAGREAITKLSVEFVEAAKTAALVIFAEKDRPLHSKAIKPINAGGLAGGTKYIHKGMFFKLVRDCEVDSGLWLYGEKEASIEAACKAAANDLRGANFYLTQFDTLGVPLVVPVHVLLDFHGFRLIAIPFLPLAKETIVYGSGDAGKSTQKIAPSTS